MLFITEACEYVRSFLTLHPTHVLVNNIDDDHLDCYRDINDIFDTFVEFIQKLGQNGILLLNQSDTLAYRLKDYAPCRIVTYNDGPCKRLVSGFPRIQRTWLRQRNRGLPRRKAGDAGAYRTRLAQSAQRPCSNRFLPARYSALTSISPSVRLKITGLPDGVLN